MTHPVDLPSPRQPVAQTEEAKDGSVPRKTVENVAPPQDRTKTNPPENPSQQKASVSQGEAFFTFYFTSTCNKTPENVDKVVTHIWMGIFQFSGCPSVPFPAPVYTLIYNWTGWF